MLAVEPRRQFPPPAKHAEHKATSPLDKAMRNLKEAESTLLQADAWLRKVAKRISRPDFDIEDANYLRGLLGSEKFETGTVTFLDATLRATQEALTQPDLDPEQQKLLEINIATLEKHLEALGLRLAGLKLLLNGPKPLQPTPARP